MKKVTNHLTHLKTILILTFLTASLALNAQSATWTGAVNTNWNTAGNWTFSGIGAGFNNQTKFIIPANATGPTTASNASVTMAGLVIGNNATATVPMGFTLKIRDDFNFICNCDGILNRGMLTNNGTIDIDNTSFIGIKNNGNGTLTNNGTIDIDDANSDGIHNLGTLTNNGTIDIDDAIAEGIHNLGTLTNNDTIDIDDTFSNGISNRGTLTNQSNGQINIGQNLSVGGTAGINSQSGGNLINDGSTIKIDRTDERGIHIEFGTITNKNGGQILIGEIGNIGRHGVTISSSGDGSFNNESGALLSIKGVSGSFHGINNGKNFKNTGTNSKVDIDMAGLGRNGITNIGTFTNEMSAEIEIDGTGENGISNNTNKTFNNSANITIGALKKIGFDGIRNGGTFNNTGGNINIDDTAIDGIYNNGGMFTNAANITIGALKKIGFHGIHNGGTFNNTGGNINIDDTAKEGISNIGGAIFTNAANIAIGALKKIGSHGIRNAGTFNNTSGNINIDDTTIEGIYNNDSGMFTNAANITIGALKKIGNHGIRNLKSIFTNTGDIQIDDTADDGISNGRSLSQAGTFTNFGNIRIGLNKTVQGDGVQNATEFNNNAGGHIQIGTVNEKGIFNKNNAFNEPVNFTNAGKLTIGDGHTIGQEGIRNEKPFTNAGCAEIYLFDKFSNTDMFTNDGLLSLNTAETHAPGNLTNNGIVEDIQGTFLTGGIANNEVVVAPTVANACETINPAFVLAGSPSFNYLGVYSDVNCSTSVGMINKNTNTFIANPTLSEGMHNLFVKIEDSGGGCTRVVSWKLTTQNCCVAPAIQTHPVGDTKCPGENVTFSVTATGSNLSYQWKKDGTNIGGASSSSLTLTNLQNSDAGDYTCEVSNNCGNETSEVATLTMDEVKPNFNGTCASYSNPFSTDAGECYATISFTVPSPTDNCGVTELKAKILDGNGNTFQNWTNNPDGQFPPDDYQIKWRAKDAAGNKKVCTKSFSVVDDESPDAQCVTSHTVQLTNGFGTISINDIDAGSSDNCNVNVGLSQTTFDCNDRGNSTVTLTATDDAGNSHTCTADIEVLGTTLSIDDLSKNEGTGTGYTFFFFKVVRGASGCTDQVDYATSDGTATLADNDYVAASGTHYFTSTGSNIRYSIVRGVKDANHESDEHFWVDLSNASAGLTITKANGKAELLNDDAAPLFVFPNQDVENPNYIQTQIQQNKVALYPNPVQDDFQLIVPHIWLEAGAVEVALFNNLGQQISGFQLTDSQAMIEVAALPTGTYQLNFRTKSGFVQTERFVKVD